MTFTLFLIFCTVALMGYAVIPMVYNGMIVYSRKREQQLSNKMDKVLPRSEAKKMAKYFVIAPVAAAAVMFFLFPEDLRLFGVVFGFIGGLLFPGMYTKSLQQKNLNKFGDQLIDALMIMSSSFRGGLSLIQAFEAVVEEMPDPINYEFGTVLGENKMGVSLEDALNHLYNRMASPALQQMITAILLARETGGNLPAIFTRIVNSIRERKKIQQNIDTLTLQGKIQGVVMSGLPIGFGVVVYSTNPHFYDSMLYTDFGRMLLMTAIILEIVGAIMIWKISTFKDL